MLLAQKKHIDYWDFQFFDKSLQRKSSFTSLSILILLSICILNLFIKKIEEIIVPVQAPQTEQMEIIKRNNETFQKPTKVRKILVEDSSFILYTDTPPPPKPIVKPKPEPTPKPEPKPEPKPKPKPEPKPKPKPKPQAQAASAAKKPEAKVAPASTAPPAQNVASLNAQKTQARQNAIAALVGWLERNKTYPRTAKRRGMQGTVQLHIVLNDQGIVTSATVVGGNAGTILKNSTQKMTQKLRGFNTGAKVSLSVKVPVVYSLQ